MGAKHFLLLAIIGFSNFSRATEPIQIGYAKFAADFTVQVLAREIELPLPSGHRTLTNITRVPSKTPNPLNIVGKDFKAGDFLNPEQTGEAPQLLPQDADWFKSVVEGGLAPDVFVIGGHQVISNGWHNHEETEFMFLPTLLRTIEVYPHARAYFDNIKFAVLGGCNTLTNLEPHKESKEFDGLSPSIAQKKLGDYLTPEEIKNIYSSGERGKNFVIGKAPGGNRWNSLEFYRHRLATEYGPGAEHFEYTRGPKREKCVGPGKYENCAITDVDRVFPDAGLWDGSHRYNYPMMMRNLFRNASLVVGYTSASPSDDRRAVILKTVFDDVRRDLNNLRKNTNSPLVSNILVPLLNEEQSAGIKELIINSLRKHWTLRTYEMNRQRPSGSITPIFPLIDAHSIFAAAVDKAPAYQPYRPSNDGPATGPVLLQLN